MTKNTTLESFSSGVNKVILLGVLLKNKVQEFMTMRVQELTGHLS